MRKIAGNGGAMVAGTLGTGAMVTAFWLLFLSFFFGVLVSLVHQNLEIDYFIPF